MNYFDGINIVFPIGMSFYIFQIIGYVIDVYKEEVNVEKDFIKYGLFISFFPKLISGPIIKANVFFTQLKNIGKVNYKNIKDGFLLMVYGYFLKIVVADRISIFVNSVYDDYTTYQGVYLIIATILYALQIYCDFAGYTNIAIGASEIIGFKFDNNFNSPYLSKSVSEFWRNWHISLMKWLKEYVYIPLGGNKKGKLIKYINLIVVFLISGIWHGMGLSFIVWGLLNAFFQIVGDILTPIKTKITLFFECNRESYGYKLFQIIITFILICFTWIFFRANSLTDAISIIKSIVTIHNIWILFDGSIFNCGLDAKNFNILIICIVIVFITDYLNKNGIIIRKIINKQDHIFRYMFIVLSIVLILLFGIWGPKYDASSFVYFKF